MSKHETIVFPILLIYLLLPILLGTFLACDLSSIGMRLIYLISGLGIYAFGLCMLKRRTFFYIACLTFIPAGVELVHMTLNQATTSLMFVFSCFKAEKGELMELITTYWFILLIALSVWTAYFLLVHRFITNEYILPKRIRLSSAAIIVIWYVICCTGLHFSKHPLRWLPINMEDERTSAWVGVEKITPVNVVLATYHILSIRADIQQQEYQVEQFHFGIAPKPSQDELIVLMIGETSRYSNWQINGYQRPTSPYMMQRADQLISFDSCFTIANLTTVSVPYMLSPATPHNATDYYKQKSLVEAFAEGGYQTAWIADQSFGNTFLQRISATCDYRYYQPHQQLERNYVDTVLLQPLQEFLTRQTKQRNQLVVLHTLGCHFKYSSRYPDDYSIFQPDMKEMDIRSIIHDINPESGRLFADKKVINELREVFVNSYDNAICYTDYVIERVIRQLEQTQRPCLFVYVGDHGENLLDDDRNMLMHGSFGGSVWEYHVPLFVWMSTEFRQQHPETFLTLQHNHTKQISTMNIFPSLLHIGGLYYNGVEINKSIFSPTLVPDTVAWGLDANLNLIALPTGNTTTKHS